MVKNLRSLRLLKGISQQKLADALNITQQAIFKYEKQKNEPDIQTLIALADYFGSTVDFLIGHTPPSAGGPQQELELSKEELSLLQDWRRLSASEKKSIHLVVQNYLQKK